MNQVVCTGMRWRFGSLLQSPDKNILKVLSTEAVSHCSESRAKILTFGIAEPSAIKKEESSLKSTGLENESIPRGYLL